MRTRTLLRTIGVLVTLLAGATALRVHEYGQVLPRGQTLDEHLATMPDPSEYRVLVVDGREHLAVRGTARLWSFASGDPVYVFDKAGRLTDCTVDAGDDNAFHARWPGVDRGRRLTREQAVKWTAGGP